MGTSITSVAEHAFEALRAAGYMESTVGQYRKIFRYLEESSPDGMWSDGVGEAFVAATRPDGRPFEHNYQLSRERVVSLCADFAGTGRFDLSMRAGRPAVPEPSHDGLCASLADYMRANEARGLAAGTRDYYARLAREYLLHLERIGVDDADLATPASVASFMADIAARWPNTSTYHLASNFRPLLRFLGRDEHGAKAFADPRARGVCDDSLGAGDGKLAMLYQANDAPQMSQHPFARAVGRPPRSHFLLGVGPRLEPLCLTGEPFAKSFQLAHVISGVSERDHSFGKLGHRHANPLSVHVITSSSIDEHGRNRGY